MPSPHNNIKPPHADPSSDCRKLRRCWGGMRCCQIPAMLSYLEITHTECHCHVGFCLILSGNFLDLTYPTSCRRRWMGESWHWECHVGVKGLIYWKFIIFQIPVRMGTLPYRNTMFSMKTYWKWHSFVLTGDRNIWTVTMYSGTSFVLFPFPTNQVPLTTTKTTMNIIFNWIRAFIIT